MAETTAKSCYGENEVGCWFDSHRGVYIGDSVIEEAIEHGWKCDIEADEDTWSDHEHYHELWNEAEDFMQQFAAEGFYFGDNESGNWGLWRVEKAGMA